MYFKSFDDFDAANAEIEILFDRAGFTKKKEVKISDEEIIEKIKQRIENIEKNNELRQSYIEKELKRGNLFSVDKYQNLILPKLIETLRLLHCPTRSEYYLKDIEKDLPPEIVKAVEDLLFPSSVEDLEVKYVKASELLSQTIEKLKLKIQK